MSYDWKLDSQPSQWSFSSKEGQYIRGQDSREKLVMRQVHGVPGHLNYYMIFSVALRYDFPGQEAETRLLNGWIALRCAHPSIAVCPVGNQMVFSALATTETQAWIRATFTVHESAESAQRYSKTIRPSPGMRLDFFPESKEIMLCASHEHADAHGMIMLLDTLCQYMSDPPEPAFEGQGDRLSPSLETVANIPPATPRARQKAAALFQQWKARASKAIYIKADLPGPSAKEVSTRRLVLSDVNTAAVVHITRAHKLSVNDVMNAAVILAIKEHGGLQEGNWLGAITTDARKALPMAQDIHKHAAGLYFLSCPAFVDNPQSMMDVAAQLRTQRSRFNEDPDSLQMLECLEELTRGKHEPSTSTYEEDHQDSMPATNHSQVEYSGLGKLDGWLRSRAGNIEIDDFWMTLGHCTSAVGVYCYTFRERTSFTLSYNQGFHSEESMSHFMDILAKIIHEYISRGGL